MAYEIVLADFPWAGYTPQGTAALPYKSMSYEEVAAFDWSRFIGKHAAVFAWVTGPKLEEQLQAMRCWRDQGLYYQGQAFVWIKTKKDGVTPIGAAGPRPRTVKPLSEQVLVYTTTPKRRVFEILDESVSQTVLAPKDIKHSRKPREVHRRIERVFGDRPRIELFCRGEAPAGWDAWGDEATNPVVLP